MQLIKDLNFTTLSLILQKQIKSTFRKKASIKKHETKQPKHPNTCFYLKTGQTLDNDLLTFDPDLPPCYLDLEWPRRDLFFFFLDDLDLELDELEDESVLL